MSTAHGDAPQAEREVFLVGWLAARQGQAEGQIDGGEWWRKVSSVEAREGRLPSLGEVGSICRQWRYSSLY